MRFGPSQARRATVPKMGRGSNIRSIEDVRFNMPLYTVAEVARYLGLARRTLGYWTEATAGGQEPVITRVPGQGQNQPVMPFVGFAEAFVAAVFRRVHGLSLQYIRKSLVRLQKEMTIEYALASEKLYTDGAKILFDYRNQDQETELLVEIVSGNAVFTDVVRDYLRRVSYKEGFADRIILPTRNEVAVVTPFRAYGQPLTLRGNARVVDLLDRFRGGENPNEISTDFGVPEPDVLEIVRAFYEAKPEAA